LLYSWILLGRRNGEDAPRIMVAGHWLEWCGGQSLVSLPQRRLHALLVRFILIKARLPPIRPNL
jgi:hypothetical protein